MPEPCSLVESGGTQLNLAGEVGRKGLSLDEVLILQSMKLRIPITTTMTTASFGACPASGLKELSLLRSA